MSRERGNWSRGFGRRTTPWHAGSFRYDIGKQTQYITMQGIMNETLLQIHD